jgi:hypothetical protein
MHAGDRRGKDVKLIALTETGAMSGLQSENRGKGSAYAADDETHSESVWKLLIFSK